MLRKVKASARESAEVTDCAIQSDTLARIILMVHCWRSVPAPSETAAWALYSDWMRKAPCEVHRASSILRLFLLRSKMSFLLSTSKALSSAATSCGCFSAATRSIPTMPSYDLALYMVSSDTARLGIIRRAKNPQTPPIIRYRDARGPICTYLTDSNRGVNPLVVAEEMLRQRAEDSSESSLRQDDARQSIEVLHAIQRMRNQLGSLEFTTSPAEQDRLRLADVEISVRADLLVLGASRGQDQVGAAVLRMTQDDAETETARSRRREMGPYVATLARLHMDQNIQSDRTVANRLCMSIDVQHGELFQAPDSNTRRMNDVENACRFIAAMWNQI